MHRDIKPQNMLILPETGDLKIMDFGIARVSEVKGEAVRASPSAGTVMGTPDYMPPEQAQGQPADFRSDIYSLGVVLFEIFTGQLPFDGDTLMAVVLSHIQKPPPRPRAPEPAPPRRPGGHDPALPGEGPEPAVPEGGRDPGQPHRHLDARRSRLTAASALLRRSS